MGEVRAGGVLLGWVGQGQGAPRRRRWHLQRPQEGWAGPGHAGMNGGGPVTERWGNRPGPGVPQVGAALWRGAVELNTGQQLSASELRPSVTA